MPSEALKSMAEKHGVSLSDAERYWKEAKKSAADSGHTEDWAYIMGIVKKRMGITSAVAADLVAAFMVEDEKVEASQEQFNLVTFITHANYHAQTQGNFGPVKPVVTKAGDGFDVRMNVKKLKDTSESNIEKFKKNIADYLSTQVKTKYVCSDWNYTPGSLTFHVARQGATAGKETAEEINRSIGELKTGEVVPALQNIIRHVQQGFQGWKLRLYGNDNGDVVVVFSADKQTHRYIDAEQLVKVGQLCAKLIGTDEVLDPELAPTTGGLEFAFVYRNGYEVEL